MFSYVSFDITFFDLCKHVVLSSNNVVGLSLIEESPHDSWIC